MKKRLATLLIPIGSVLIAVPIVDAAVLAITTPRLERVTVTWSHVSLWFAMANLPGGDIVQIPISLIYCGLLFLLCGLLTRLR
jgi:hypothetical protein